MAEIRGNTMGRVRHIHFVGIGGAGMSGIAEIMHNLGYKISGSDLKNTNVTAHLQKLGISVVQGHSGDQVIGSDVVVVSSAVARDNPELLAAREKRIPVIPRAEMLAEIMRFRHGIAIAGTHGKTTTTSLIASILAEAGLDPTFVIGGQLNSIGSNAKLGSSKYLVAEADESDASFLHLQPLMAVLTNIDVDHLETYGGDFARLSDTFLEFLQRLPFYGLAVLCVDDQGVRQIINSMVKPFITYGIDHPADFTATDLRFDGARSSFSVSIPGRSDYLLIDLNLPGKHNVLNALAAIAIATELGINDSSIRAALHDFQGISRRCNVLGVVEIDQTRAMVIDDYAHHPSEIRAILAALKSGWPDTRIVVIFQPHRFTRTRDLFDEFCRVLAEVDVLLLFNVYPAGEKPIAGADSQALCEAIRASSNHKPLLIQDRAELNTVLPGVLEDNDIILIMGAGDIGSLGPELMAQYKTAAHQGYIN